MQIVFYNDHPQTAQLASQMDMADVLGRLGRIDRKANERGPETLDPHSDPLIPIGTEMDASRRVIKNGYGVFSLSWHAEKHERWASAIRSELDDIRARIHEAHGTRLRFLIWAGMGGSAEDKSMYNAAGLLKRSPRCYVLDSTDPAKLDAILDDMTSRTGLGLDAALRATLVVGMAMGMTSYEPVVNLQRLAALYDKHKIRSEANFVYMTLPDSLLDQFARSRNYRRIELQPDGRNTTAGRHSAPLTRGSLYPLGLCGVDLSAWMQAAALDEEQIFAAWRLSAFLHSHGVAGRDKVTLLPPKAWSGAALWTKQDFEESLGKSEDLGIKILIGEKLKLAHLRPPKDPAQDRIFLAIAVKGDSAEDGKIQLLRRAGYPVARVVFPSRTSLSTYLQFIHYAVFGVAYFRDMNFVTQPGVELYKSITNTLFDEAQKLGGLEKTTGWREFLENSEQWKWRNGITVFARRGLAATRGAAPELYASALSGLHKDRKVSYGELTYFGDLRYSVRGRAVRAALNRCGEILFRSALKMPVDIYEGPAMNHSYHEMIIGHGGCASTILAAEKPAPGSEYHRAQFLATVMALQRRDRPVFAITMRDSAEKPAGALEEFFREAARCAKL